MQNKVITDTIAELNQAIEDAKALRASLETYGMVKFSNSSAVTENVGLALPASEKNPSIEGTLANLISSKISEIDFELIGGQTADEIYQQIFAQIKNKGVCAGLVGGTYFYIGYNTNNRGFYFMELMEKI